MSRTTDAVNKRLEELEDLRKSLEGRTKKDTNVSIIVDTKTRDFLARGVVIAFFSLLAVIIIGVPLYDAFVASDKRLDLTNILQQYSSILGPVLGFVLGYYFKSKE
ncbi:MAG TPA: hypothetical protein VFB03_02985 [Candidatus Saccharimonadales bacterium]|nr:hypothetical protein [Candidatus Saccharimonadales bacterium]